MDAEEVAKEYLDSGSVELQEFKQLKVGSRVRLSGQQWPDAYRIGTGTIERIFHRQNSSWERSWGRPDVELIVRYDKPPYEECTHAFVADYHVDLAEEQP